MLPIKAKNIAVPPQLEKEYKEKLSAQEGILPDPNSLCENWIGEPECHKLWPCTTYVDVVNFLLFTPCELSSKELNKYKTTKAYSYLERGWLQKIAYHFISDTSSYCFIKTTCKRSERLHESSHQLWVCINKSTGQIHSGYCSCKAGLGETCNHVAALLFKVEMVNRSNSRDKLACTSMQCEWGIPKKEVEPQLIKNLNFRYNKYTNISGLNKRKTTHFSLKKKKFMPENGYSSIFSSLDRIKQFSPTSVIFTASDPPIPQDKSNNTGSSNVLSIMSIASRSANRQLSTEDQVAKFMAELKKEYNSENIQLVEKKTRGQAENRQWILYRRGMITASNFHRVFTKVNTIQIMDNPHEIDISNLIDTLTSENILCVPQIRYGKQMEPIARNDYVVSQTSLHDKFVCEDSGLLIHPLLPFLAASPDAIIHCECCGTGCLEIKCPFSIQDSLPEQNLDKLHFLKIINGQININTRHQYYSQILGQMAISGYKYCDFFVWTKKGYWKSRILFDSIKWKEIEQNLIYFFTNFLAPALLEQSNPMTGIQARKQIPVQSKCGDANATINSCATTTKVTQSLPVTKKRITKSLIKTKDYLCGICGILCKEVQDITDTIENSIQCDKCKLWCHFRCTGLTGLEDFLEDESTIWNCSKCHI